MRFLNFLLIISCLILYIKASCETDEEDTISYRDFYDCEKRSFDDYEVENDAYICCQYESEYESVNIKKKVRGCSALTRNEYDNIRSYINNAKSINHLNELYIDCKSSFLTYGLYLLFLILFTF